eukprot:2285832-Amphidinium_carterae.1
MKTLMARAGCPQNEINQAYEFYKRGPSGYEQMTTVQQVQPALREEDDDAQSTYGDSSRLSSTRASDREVLAKGCQPTVLLQRAIQCRTS